MTFADPTKPTSTKEKSRRVLAPIERFSEILFGLIMVLTFTGSLSAAGSGRTEVHTMLIGALGCNLAWGIIDAIFYLLNTLAERGHSIVALRRLRTTADPEEAHALIAEELPPGVVSVLRPEELETLRQRLTAFRNRQRAFRSTATTSGGRWQCFSSSLCPRSRWSFRSW